MTKNILKLNMPLGYIEIRAFEGHAAMKSF